MNDSLVLESTNWY